MYLYKNKLSLLLCAIPSFKNNYLKSWPVTINMNCRHRLVSFKMTCYLSYNFLPYINSLKN